MGPRRRLFEQKMTSPRGVRSGHGRLQRGRGKTSAGDGAVQAGQGGAAEEEIDQARGMPWTRPGHSASWSRKGRARRTSIRPAQGEAGGRRAPLAETQLGYAKIYSPLDGVVLSKNIERGEYVAPGTPVVTVADMVNVWLRAYVDETDLDRVKLGQAARDHHRRQARQGLQGPRLLYLAGGRVHAQDRADGEGAGETGVPHQDRHDEPGRDLKAGMPADAIIRGKAEGGRGKARGNFRALELTTPYIHPSPFRLSPFFPCPSSARNT